MTEVFCCFCEANIIKTLVISPEFLLRLAHSLLPKIVTVRIKIADRAPLNLTSVRASPSVGIY